MQKLVCLIVLLFSYSFLKAQNEYKNWYFGRGTDGITFVNNIPQKLSDKRPGVGFEGMIVVNNPIQGNLLFYSDGEQVVDANHNIMTNGTGLNGHFSGANCVQSCPVTNSCYKKFYLFTSTAWDETAGKIYYSIVDFTNNPLGEVTNKNTLLWDGPSDQGMCLASKPNSNDFWLITNKFQTAEYYVWPVSAGGIGTPQTYTFSNTGASYQMNYSKTAKKLTVTGFGNKKVTLLDFDANTGVLSNEIQIGNDYTSTWATRFSPDGSKLYAGLVSASETVPSLYQYDFATSVWNKLNTCCYAHDLKLGPDGKMYFLKDYNVPQPMAVIDFPNLSAVGNACGYRLMNFAPAFNGEVRRFPEVLVLPDPPIANVDIRTITGTSLTIPILTNDVSPQGSAINLDAIVRVPSLGSINQSGNSLVYTPNQNICGKTDTLIYRITDENCASDTAMVLINFPGCPTSNPQFCTGSLGNPIVNITFGSAANNPGPQLSTAVPGASTNYNFASYATGTPPSPPIDGDYALINQVATNSAWFTGEKDHTGNPDGYMAFFNADPIPGKEFYRQTVNGLCPGTTYEFAAWVVSVLNSDLLPGSISPNITFRILNPANNAELANFNTGDITNTNVFMWKQYSFLFTTPTGINSVVLILSNNNVGGMVQQGNDLAIDDITFRPCGPLTNASFSASTQIDSISINNCGTANLFGKITGSFNTPSYQWQLSNDDGNTFNNISGATSLNTAVSGLTDGLYQLQLLSAESGNIGSPTCRFISNKVKLLVTGCSIPVGCNNWLKITGDNDYATIGDLDITGNQITVEASFNADTNYFIPSTVAYDLVSKHTDPSDCNYLLRPVTAEITTSNGFFQIVACDYTPKKVNHAALVYDGSTLKFYRNGFLMGSKPASGNLVTNDLITKIGNYAAFTRPEALKGYINEVRIWNRARTESEIKTYMNSSLPSPATQPGLVAYYTFDNLINKQGNTTWNATLNGTASINATNPSCTFFADSCLIPPTPCNNWLHIPNSQSYATVGEIDIPGTSITVEGMFSRDSAFTPEGYTSLNVVSKHWTPADANYLLRVDRAEITTSNGYFVTPDICELENKRLYHAAMTYDGSILKFYRNGFLMSQTPCTGNMFQNDYLTTIGATANSPTTNTQLIGYLNEIRIWNVVKSQAELQAYMNKSLPNPATQPGLLGYYTFDNLLNQQGNAAFKITLQGNATINRTVPNCNFQIDSCLIACANIDSVRITTIQNTCNTFNFNGLGYTRSHPIKTWQWSFGDGNTANTQNTNHKYNSTGTFPVKLVVTDINDCKDSITINVSAQIINIKTNNDTAVCYGEKVQLLATGASSYTWTPGAGLNNAAIGNPIASPADTTQYIVSTTGTNGCIAADTVTIFVNPLPVVNAGNDAIICMGENAQLSASGAGAYSWAPVTGLSSPTIFNPVAAPADTTQYVVIGTNAQGCSATDTVWVFVKPVPVVNAGAHVAICKNENTQLLATGGATYLWKPATGLDNAAVANPLASPGTTTEYIVTGTAANGCTGNDTVLVIINPPPSIIKTSDTLICDGKSVQLLVSGADSYVWSPAISLNATNIANPVATPVADTKYYIESTDGVTNCTAFDSIKVSVRPKAVFEVSADKSVCSGAKVQLIASGGDQYLWSPAALVNNPTAGSVLTSPASTTTYTVKIKESVCNDSIFLNTTVSILGSLQLTVSKSNDVDCLTDTVQLLATGGNKYVWTSNLSPFYLNNPNIANPVAHLTTGKMYYVTATDTTTGCTATDSITVNEITTTLQPFYAPNAFSPNDDGHNDCYKIFANGTLRGFEMAIYNRWGQLVFTTSNPNECWDGRFKGKKQDPGNYVVYIKARNKCIRDTYKSNLILLR